MAESNWEQPLEQILQLSTSQQSHIIYTQSNMGGLRSCKYKQCIWHLPVERAMAILDGTARRIIPLCLVITHESASSLHRQQKMRIAGELCVCLKHDSKSA